MASDLFQRLDHVGIVVNSLDEAIATYTRLGFGLLQRIAIGEHGRERRIEGAGLRVQGVRIGFRPAHSPDHAERLRFSRRERHGAGHGRADERRPPTTLTR